MNHVRFDARYLSRKRRGAKHGPTRHRRRQVKLSYIPQSLGKAAEVLKRQDVAIEVRAIQAAYDIGEETLHAPIIQILNYVEHSCTAGCPLGIQGCLQVAQLRPRTRNRQ